MSHKASKLAPIIFNMTDADEDRVWMFECALDELWKLLQNPPLFVNESVIGTRFTGRLVEATAGGAVVPEITGRAWVTGRAEYVLDPEDPFPAGFALR